MTNEYNEELTKIANELKRLTNVPDFYHNWSNLARIKTEIRILNDLIRKINEELE